MPTAEKPSNKSTLRPPGSRMIHHQTRSEDRVLPSLARSTGSFLIEVVKVIIIALAIIIPVRYFLMQPFYVKGASMEPTFHDNEYLIIDELTYRLSAPKRGDVIVFHNPRRPSEFYIKRLIGLPGERVEISRGQIKITNTEKPNGYILDEAGYLPTGIYTNGNDSRELANDEFYVLGDNRSSSLDSRVFGAITRSEIVGRIWLRAWPINKIQRFTTPTFSTSTVSLPGM